ncbi:LOW QUALITY PROTEIN: R3H and coiled-coil domain-containing protein 1 [Boleophthalmus pectinirostris]|uniref:LOW QUALITY PROTEIN: R3H and coiled-coil domain-containing protein 1 n=1 Tax=Boleophthalmus pectinirostris TaxID=150288 RepID=UPI00242BBC81|nr:LOW QUALITY PROTEIN: R3H and coiled-coil domain-containing protein 1 [Boleophthalmus pectinirostris]
MSPALGLNSQHSNFCCNKFYFKLSWDLQRRFTLAFRCIDGVYLPKHESEFVHLVLEELDAFEQEEQRNRVLLFPPLSSRWRYLTHRTVEDRPELCSFSVGEDLLRRVAVCFCHIRGEVKDDADLEKSDVLHEEEKRKESTPKRTKEEKNRTKKRPDQPLYLPRALRERQRTRGRGGGRGGEREEEEQRTRGRGGGRGGEREEEEEEQRTRGRGGGRGGEREEEEQRTRGRGGGRGGEREEEEQRTRGRGRGGEREEEEEEQRTRGRGGGEREEQRGGVKEVGVRERQREDRGGREEEKRTEARDVNSNLDWTLNREKSADPPEEEEERGRNRGQEEEKKEEEKKEEEKKEEEDRTRLNGAEQKVWDKDILRTETRDWTVPDSTPDSALDSALDSTLDSAPDSTLDSALNSALDSALDSAPDSTLNSALDRPWTRPDSTLDSALDLALDSVRLSCECENPGVDSDSEEISQEVRAHLKAGVAFGLGSVLGDFSSFESVSFCAEAFAHVIEIYDFPPLFQTQDLLDAFTQYSDGGMKIKWVDNTHALGIFSCEAAALQALSMSHPLLKTRPLSQGSNKAKGKALRRAEFLQPVRERPRTDCAVARRMVTRALGLQRRGPRY